MHEDQNRQPQSTPERCICCGEPATRRDVNGLPLCEGDYEHLAEHSALENFGDQNHAE